MYDIKTIGEFFIYLIVVLVIFSSIILMVFGLAELIGGSQFDGEVVDYVHDGDTFKMNNGDWIRIAMIDAPEIEEVGGVKSKHYLKYKIEGEVVDLECEDEIGYYGRKICSVYYNGKNVGAGMVSKGLAEPYTFDK